MSRKTPTAFKRNSALILETDAGSASAPTASTDGKAVSDIITRNPSPLNWVVEIASADDSTSATVSSVKLYGWTGNRWLALADLNSGDDITVAAQGYAEVVSYMGLYSRIAVSFSTTNNIDVALHPINQIGV